MIQAYKKYNTEFSRNGDIVLFPDSCKIKTAINNTWEMQLSHPLDEEGRWEYLEEEGVIAAPTFQSEKQLFRIHEIEKTDTEISAAAYPIFYDSADDGFLLDIRPEVKNGQQALDIMMDGTKYSGESDITTSSTAYFVRRNLMDAINGQTEPTFIQRWGGEILYDNYKIIINNRIGGEYGTEIRYGKNMDGISYNIDMSEVVTRIIPVAYNGYTLQGETQWVDSPNINKYAKIYMKEVKFEDVKLTEDAQDGETANNTLEELHEALIQKCKEMYDAGADMPSVTIEINMIDLAYTEEYELFEELERVGLGDTVGCHHSRLGITTKSRVVELEWDGILNKPGKIKLGDFEYNYFSELESTISAIKKVMGPGNTIVAERVKGVLNAIDTQLRYQKSVAQRQDVRAILFEDTMTDSPTFGAMCLGTQGFQIADHRTTDGREWDWSTAFTAKGGYADVFIAGLLSDKTGRSFWNLDTGELQLSGVFRQFAVNGRKSIDIAENEIRLFAWNDDGNYTGSLGALKGNGTESERVGIGLWCDDSDIMWIGYKNPSDQRNIKPVIKFDATLPDTTPWIANGANGKISPGGLNINVENGFIKNWDNKGATGTLYIPNKFAWKENTSTGYMSEFRVENYIILSVNGGAITGWKVGT